MNKIVGLLTARWLISLVGVCALGVLIWFVGPLLAIAGWQPLAAELNRVLAILAVIVLWGLGRLWTYWRTKRSNQQIIQEMTAPDPAVSETKAEIATLRRGLEEALTVLKRAKLGGRRGRQYLYQLPWYVLIGPPGSGKTTALVNSGLNFPLAQRFGKEIRGVGGTRYCDWLFTDEAVLLDTAGRYTTQDSHQAVDKAAWRGFLHLLKKYRHRRPINGALIAVSVADLLRQDETERSNHALIIRQRIQELHEQLGIRFPIYMLFTKCDLVAGFIEFFDDLGREERAQVWGMTFPLDDAKHPPGVIERFPQEFTVLEKRLEDRLLERLQQERDPRRRDLIFLFPQQIAALREIIPQFLEEIFQPNRYEERPLLRGVYFTSGTQEGTPIDRLMNSLAATFNLDQQALSAFSGPGKSYFITRLLRDVIFQEAGLAGTDLRLERQRRWLQRGAYASILILTVLVISAWSISYTQNQAYVSAVEGQIESIDKQLRDLYPEQRDPLATLPALNAAAKIPGGDIHTATRWLMRFGLYQGDKLGPKAKEAYQRLLNTTLLPRVMVRVEDRLRQHVTNPGALYEDLKVYLMLTTSPEHFDAATIRTLVTRDWEHNLPYTRQQRQQLAGHLDALVAQGPLTPPLDPDTRLIQQTREILTRVPLAQQVYGHLKGERLAEAIQDFRISDVAGRHAPLVFIRKSGQPLNSGVPGLYTYAGYHQIFARESLRLINASAAESWILGSRYPISTDSGQRQELITEVHRLYLEDYANHWEEFLADIDIVPLTGLQQVTDTLRILSGSESPLRKLLEGVVQETTLNRPLSPEEAGKLASAVGGSQQVLQEEAEFAQDTGSVARRFAPLHRQVQRLDTILPKLEELSLHMGAIANGTGGPLEEEAKRRALSIIAELDREAGSESTALGKMLKTLTQDSTGIILGGIRRRLNAVWTTEVLPYCRQALNGRYPLSLGSQREITLQDFGSFFGPSGLIKDFFQKHLQPYVDTSATPWRWNSAGAKLGISSSVLMQFQYADRITQAFFQPGSQTPSARFELRPVSLDPNINQFFLDLDGQQLTYSHGPTRSTALQWPGPGSFNQVRIQFLPPALSGRSGITEDGPWAWFKVLDQANLRPASSPELFHIIFQIGDRKAYFELRASSAFNPFHLSALEQFRCPERL